MLERLPVAAIFIAMAILIWLLLDIRERLPKNKNHSDYVYFPPAKEGFNLMVDEVYESDFEVGYDGSWQHGSYFDAIGRVSSYECEGTELGLLEKYSVRVHGVLGGLDGPRVGNVWVKDGVIRSDGIHIELPMPLYERALETINAKREPLIEISIGKDRKPVRHGSNETYGVYRLTIRSADSLDRRILSAEMGRHGRKAPTGH